MLFRMLSTKDPFVHFFAEIICVSMWALDSCCFISDVQLVFKCSTEQLVICYMAEHHHLLSKSISQCIWYFSKLAQPLTKKKVVGKCITIETFLFKQTFYHCPKNSIWKSTNSAGHLTTQETSSKGKLVQWRNHYFLTKTAATLK